MAPDAESRYSFISALLNLSGSLLFCIVRLQSKITAYGIMHSKALNPHTVALHLRMIRAAETGTGGYSRSRWKQAQGKRLLISGVFDLSHSEHPQQGTSSWFQSRHRPACFQAHITSLNTLSTEWRLMSRTSKNKGYRPGRPSACLGEEIFFLFNTNTDILFFDFSFVCCFNAKLNVVELTDRLIKAFTDYTLGWPRGGWASQLEMRCFWDARNKPQRRGRKTNQSKQRIKKSL